MKTWQPICSRAIAQQLRLNYAIIILPYIIHYSEGKADGYRL